MMLSNLEQGLIGIALTMLGWCLAGRNRVSIKACEEHREKMAEDHSNIYTTDRRILLVDDHKKICDDKLSPMKDDIAEIKRDVKSLLKRG